MTMTAEVVEGVREEERAIRWEWIGDVVRGYYGDNVRFVLFWIKNRDTQRFKAGVSVEGVVQDKKASNVQSLGEITHELFDSISEAIAWCADMASYYHSKVAVMVGEAEARRKKREEGIAEIAEGKTWFFEGVKALLPTLIETTRLGRKS